MALNDKDIDTQMAADWGAIREKFKEESPEPETPVPEPETPEPEAPTQEPVVDRGDGRRKDGTFAPKAKEIADAPEKVDAAPEKSSGNGTQIPENNASPSAIPRDITKPPSTWKPGARAEYEKLPQAVKAEVHRREEDWMRAQNQLVPEAQFGNSMRKVIEPYRMLIEAEGGTPERAVGELMRTAAILRVGTPQQKRDVVLSVARQYGVDLGTVQPQPGQPQQTFQDPRVDQVLQMLQTQEQQRQQSEYQEREGAATHWMEEVDEKGAPIRPYLADVMNDMQALVPQIRQASPSLSHEQVLQSAYERAIWASPDVRPLLLQAQAAAAARPSDSQNRVRDAKRAASVNVPRRASQPAPGKPGTLEDTLTETARTLGLLS